MQIKTKGLVIHEMPISDQDKRLILLTKECGKVTVFAKGAKRPTSHFFSVSQLFAYGDYFLFQGRSAYHLNSGDLIESFHDLRGDLVQMTYGMFVLELADYLSNDQEPNPGFMRLVLKTLKVLEGHPEKARLIATVYRLRALCDAGYTPDLTPCSLCGEKDLYAFSLQSGGLICPNHGEKDIKAIPLSPGTLSAMQHSVTSDLATLYRFELDLSLLIEFEQIIEGFMEQHINQTFKSLTFLKDHMELD